MPCSKFQNRPPLKSFYRDTFDHFSLLKKYEHGFSTKILRTMIISERHVIERHLSDNRHIEISDAVKYL